MLERYDWPRTAVDADPQTVTFQVAKSYAVREELKLTALLARMNERISNLEHAMNAPTDAEERVIRAALSFDAVMGEFEGDISACGEHMDCLFTACDALRKARASSRRASGTRC